MISYTTDADLAMHAEDYSPKLKRAFAGNKEFTLDRSFGLIDKGFGLCMYNSYFYCDLFFMFKFNETHRWVGLHKNGLRQYRYHFFF